MFNFDDIIKIVSRVIPINCPYRDKVRYMAYYIRNNIKLMLGYKIVNPYVRGWFRYPAENMKRVLDHVFRVSDINLPVSVMIDHGGGDGSHYAAMLRVYTTKLIGVDVLELDSCDAYDAYISVPTKLSSSYFNMVEDESIDLVLVLSSIGIAVGQIGSIANWNQYFVGSEGRQSRYFLPCNYPRILKNGGYLVVIEWEAYPEKRFGKHVEISEVNRDIDKYYPHAEIAGFDFITKGFSPEKNGPYVVYRKAYSKIGI